MRVPTLKSSLVFAAGFVTCFVCVVILAFSLRFLVVQRLPDNQSKLRSAGQNEQRPALPAPELPSVQPAAFDFRVSGKNGLPFDFQKYRGKVIVLNHWSTGCGPCMAELPSLGALAAHYAGDKDVAVLCVSGEPPDVIFKNAKALGSGAPLYSTGGAGLPDVYTSDKGVPMTMIPATFIIDPQGTIAFRSVGSADWANPAVFQFIDSLKSRQTPPGALHGG